jgi:hypothetical protein
MSCTLYVTRIFYLILIFCEAAYINRPVFPGKVYTRSARGCITVIGVRVHSVTLRDACTLNTCSYYV